MRTATKTSWCRLAPVFERRPCLVPWPRVGRRGSVRLAFSVYLALGVMLGLWPAVRHLQGQYRLELQSRALLNRPLEAESAEVLLRARQLAGQVKAYHGMLEAAENHLWQYKSNRESSLILKDVGDGDGELGLAALKPALPQFNRNLAELDAALAWAGHNWNALRARVSESRYREVDRSLSDVARSARRQQAWLGLYGKKLEQTDRLARQLRRLAPQVARPVPRVIRGLPGQLRPLRAAISKLEAALKKFSREGPNAADSP